MCSNIAINFYPFNSCLNLKLNHLSNKTVLSFHKIAYSKQNRTVYQSEQFTDVTRNDVDNDMAPKYIETTISPTVEELFTVLAQNTPRSRHHRSIYDKLRIYFSVFTSICFLNLI